MGKSTQVVLHVVGLVCLMTALQTAAQPNVAIQWNSLLSSLACGSQVMVEGGYLYGALHVAQWQSLIALKAAGSPTTPEAVVAYASHHVLAHLFKYNEDKALDGLLQAQIKQLGLSPSQRQAARVIAKAVASEFVLKRANEGIQFSHDGSFKVPTSADADLGEFSFNDPPQAFYIPGFPAFFYAQNTIDRSYVMPSAESFRRNFLKRFTPPAVPSPQFDHEVDIVYRLGGTNSSERTVAQSFSALFWAFQSKGSTCTQMDAWFDAGISQIPPNTPTYDIVLFLAKLGGGFSDSFSNIVNLQWTYRNARPADTIQRSRDPSWFSFLFTPLHPDYPSGTATYAGMARTILEAHFPNATNITVTGRKTEPIIEGAGIPDIPGPRVYASWKDMALDAAMSRVYAGAHYQNSVLDGLKIGKKFANYILDNFFEQTPHGVLPGPSFIPFYQNDVSTVSVPETIRLILPRNAAEYAQPLPTAF